MTKVFTIVANEVVDRAVECTLIQFSYNPEQIHESVEETVAISKRWLENNIKETVDEEMSDLETFLRNYTTDDVNEVLGMAILNNAVAFTYCDARKEAFEMYGTESWMAMAVVDFVASKLEGSAEGNNAASMVKKLFAR